MAKLDKNPRAVAVEIMTRWLKKEDVPVDRIRDEVFSQLEDMDQRDKALVTEIVYGITRNIEAIDKQLSEVITSPLKKMQHKLLAILRVGLYQVQFLDKVPDHAAVDDAVSQAKKAFGPPQAGLVNAVLRRCAGMEVQRQVDAFYGSQGPMPTWKRHWDEMFGEEKTEGLINFFARIPAVGLRRNLLLSKSDEEWFEILKKEGVEFETIPDWPGYVYAKKVNPSDLQSFKDGITTVHDPAAGIAPNVLDPQPGESVLDLCSAPGGKTALTWELMKGEGALLSVEKIMKRSKLVREGLQRLQHKGVEVFTADAMSWSGGPFDRVLVDVPCSGTGTAHRRPDLLARRQPTQVLEMVKLQRSLLEHAASMVKVGGVLVYSTCSLEPAENSKRIRMFNKKLGAEFQLDEIPAHIPEAWIVGKGEVATWPPDHNVDGAYVARWRRIS